MLLNVPKSVKELLLVEYGVITENDVSPPSPPVPPPNREYKEVFGLLIETDESIARTNEWRKCYGVR